MRRWSSFLDVVVYDFLDPLCFNFAEGHVQSTYRSNNLRAGLARPCASMDRDKIDRPDRNIVLGDSQWLDAPHVVLECSFGIPEVD